MRLLIQTAAPLILAIVLAACSQKPAVTGATLNSFGIYQASTAGRVEKRNSSSGYVNYAETVQLVKSTDVIEARKGLTFGIAYTLTGTPSQPPIPIVVRIKHPRITNSELGKIFDFQDDPHTDAIGVPSFSGFLFEKDWEMVPGTWTFQVFHGSKMLLEKTFTVVDGRNGA